MKIAVTGGAGFIGSNFINHMLKNYPDYEILCIDSLTYSGNTDNLEFAEKSRRFTISATDITDRELIFTLFEHESPDVVVNFAAESHVDRSIENPEVFIKTNVLGTQILLDASLKFSAKRFHQVSTDEVYGDLPVNRPDLLFHEKSPLKPSSPYSASKAAADLLALSYFKTYGLPVTISRCSNNYGPFQFPEKLIPLMIINALKNKKLPLYGTGENIRDWLHVDDHCKAIDIILNAGKAGEVYNIGGGNEMKNIDIVQMILKEIGKPKSLIEYVLDRKGHDLRYAIDSSKITRELGWKTEIQFEVGIKDTIKWYLDNLDWLSRIESGEYQKYYLGDNNNE